MDTIRPLAVLEEVNKARTDPVKYADVVGARKDQMNGHILTLGGQAVVTKEGVAAIDEAVDFLKNMSPVEPLTKLVDEMSDAAAAHVEDMGQSGGASHIGSDGSDPVSRLADRGQWGDVVGENLDFGADTAVDVVVSMLVDDGWDGKRVHRINLLDPDFRVCGVASGPHTKSKVMTCVILANAFGDNVPVEQKAKVKALLEQSGRASDVSEDKIDEFVASLQDPSKTVWLPPSGPEEQAGDDKVTVARADVLAYFKNLDKDGSGDIGFEEVQAMEQQFDLPMDISANSADWADGKVTVDEMIGMLEKNGNIVD